MQRLLNGVVIRTAVGRGALAVILGGSCCSIRRNSTVQAKITSCKSNRGSGFADVAQERHSLLTS